MLLNQIRQSQNTLLQLSIVYLNHYETLQVSPSATQDQIKARFKYLAKIYHPDSRFQQRETQNSGRQKAGNTDEIKNRDHSFQKSEQILSKEGMSSAGTQNADQTSNRGGFQEKNSFDKARSDKPKDYQQFLKIKEAYEVLKDYNSRRAYDYEMFPEKIQKQAEKFYYYRSVSDAQQENQERKRQTRNTFRSFMSYTVAFTTIYLLYNYSPKFNKIIDKVTEEKKFIQPQNIDDSIAAQERRKKYYAAEMKSKKIYGNVVELKVKGAGEESTRAKKKRKQGLCSIEGVTKERTLEQTVDLVENSREYM